MEQKVQRKTLVRWSAGVSCDDTALSLLVHNNGLYNSFVHIYEGA